MILLTLTVVLTTGYKPALTIPQEARMLRLRRGSLISQVWKDSERLQIDSGYINRTLGQHTIVYFPFSNGDELLFSTWSSSQGPQRLTYWRRRGADLSRVCQLQASDNGGTFDKLIVNGGKDLPASVPYDLRVFLKKLRPCVAYFYNPGADELSGEVILSDGKEVEGMAASSKESGGYLEGAWCESNGGPPMLKQELTFLKLHQRLK